MLENIRRKVINLRNSVMKNFEDYEFFLMPTISFAPPSIKTIINDEKYHYYNNLALNNTRGINAFDLCAISLPLNITSRSWLSISIISKKIMIKNF